MAYYIKNPFGLTNAEQEKILTESFTSTYNFAHYFLPDYNKTKSPSYQPIIFNQFDAPDNKPIALVITRDGGKSTMAKAHVLKKLLFAKKANEWGLGDIRQEFIGWSSSNKEKAQNNLLYVQAFIEKSELIKYFFGELKGKRWTMSYIETIHGDTLRSTSNLSGLRGDTIANVETGAERYSMIIADDSENETNTITVDARKKFDDLIIKGMLPAIERNQLGNKFIFINTPIHYAGFTQSMIELYNKAEADPELKKNLEWKVMFYPAIVPKIEGQHYEKEDIVDSDILPKGIYSWAGRLNKDYLESAFRKAAESNTGVEGFYQEYMLEVQSDDDATFGRKMLKYHDGIFHIQDNKPYLLLGDKDIPVQTFIGCDPATDIKTKKSDFSVILSIAIDKIGNVYVLHYEHHKSIPTMALRDKDDKIIGKMGITEYLFNEYDRVKCEGATVEDVAMTRSVFQGIAQREEIENNHSRHWVRISPAGAEKINKIYTFLNPLFSSGKIYIRKTHQALENEIITFGAKMAHDDLIESLFFAIKNSFKPIGEAKKVERRNRVIKRKKKWWLL